MTSPLTLTVIEALRGASLLGPVSIDGSPIQTQASGDARYLQLTGGTLTGNLGVNGTVNATGLFLASGGGMQFPATQVPSAGANVLDDYEEGTWTPAITIGGASTGITYGTRLGGYTKIGRQVAIIFDIPLTSKGALTGTVGISNFPFSTGTTDRGSGVISFYSGLTSPAPSFMSLFPAVSSTSSTIFAMNNTTTGLAGIQDTAITSTSRFAGSITYFTD